MSRTVRITKTFRLKCNEAVAAARLPADENTAAEIIALLFVSLIPADHHGSAAKK